MDLFSATALIVLSCSLGSTYTCGVPLFMWNLVYAFLIAFRSATNLLKIPLIRTDSRWLNVYTLFSFTLLDGAFLTWLIYGNVLFYSKEDNCNSLDGTKGLYRLTLVLLIVGYFHMLLYSILLLCLPIVFFQLRH